MPDSATHFRHALDARHRHPIGHSGTRQRKQAGVTRYLSEHYRDENGLSDSSLRWEIGRFLRQKRSLDIVIPTDVLIALDANGKTGTVQFPMSLTIQGSGGSLTTQMDLTLRVTKEPVYYFWFFPGEEWKVTSASGYVPME